MTLVLPCGLVGEPQKEGEWLASVPGPLLWTVPGGSLGLCPGSPALTPQLLAFRAEGRWSLPPLTGIFPDMCRSYA